MNFAIARRPKWLASGSIALETISCVEARKSDGTTTTMPLSTEEVAALAAIAPTLLQMVRSSAVPVAAMDVFDLQLRAEML
jgi:hypothetical protein